MARGAWPKACGTWARTEVSDRGPKLRSEGARASRTLPIAKAAESLKMRVAVDFLREICEMVALFELFAVTSVPFPGTVFWRRSGNFHSSAGAGREISLRCRAGREISLHCRAGRDVSLLCRGPSGNFTPLQRTLARVGKFCPADFGTGRQISPSELRHAARVGKFCPADFRTGRQISYFVDRSSYRRGVDRRNLRGRACFAFNTV